MAADNLDELLRFDPLATAEKLTGKSYKEDEATSALGLLMHLDLHDQKKAALLDADDTTFTNELPRYDRIVTEMGFSLVLSLPFTGQAWSDEPAPSEQLRVWFHPDGLLLVHDTHQTTKVNAAKVYYNWRPTDPEAETWRLRSSGAWTDGTWVGDHDAREALRHHMGGLRGAGRFVSPWVKAPFLWLLHYMDTKAEGYDYKAINAERMALLPAHVVACIEGGASVQRSA